MAARASKFVSSWLAGQFDRDHIVASNVRKAIRSLLKTDEKLVAFYTRHHAAALNYAYNVIQETPETISDERSVSKVDMMTKYFIVLGSSISLVLEFLQRLDKAEISKVQEDYNRFLSSKKLWNLVSCEDTNIRRTICDLLIECCQKQRSIILKNIEVLGKAFIGKGSQVSQQGSASKLVDALQALTDTYPDVWMLNNMGEKSYKISSEYPPVALKSFILAGSQLEGSDFWKSLEKLIIILPLNTTPQNTTDSTEFLKSLRTSISRRGGLRAGMKNAWELYFKISEKIISHMADNESRLSLLKNAIFPLFNLYLDVIIPSGRTTEFSSKLTRNEIETNVAMQAYRLCLQYISNGNDFFNEWKFLGDEFIKKIKASLPEEAKSFRSSQDLVLALSKSWFSLLAEVLKYYKIHEDYDFDQDPLFTKSIDIVKAAFDFMVLRDGKTYCAAGILEDAVSLTPVLFTSAPDRLVIIQDLLKNHLPEILNSPSAYFVIPIIYQLSSLPGLEDDFEEIWHGVVQKLVTTYEPATEMVMIKIAVKLISDKSISVLAQKHQKLQEFLLKQIDHYIFRDYACVPIIIAALSNNALSESSAKMAIKSLTEHLNDDYEVSKIVYILGLLNNYMHHLMDATSDIHLDLLCKLLTIRDKALLEQGDESELAENCQTLKNAIIGNSFVDSISRLVTEDLKKKGKIGHGIL